LLRTFFKGKGSAPSLFSGRYQAMIARREAMKMLKVSDELYERLKSFIVDPFDDTPEVVMGRLIEIATKAKSRWAPLDAVERPAPVQRPVTVPQSQPLHELREPLYEHVEQEVIL
jgi:hypothetical protein